MFPTKNCYKSTNILSTGSHKSFPIHYVLWGKFLKRMLTYLYCTKCNEIDMCHLDVKKPVSYKK